MQLGGRVVVFGPHAAALGYAGVVTRVHSDGAIDVACFPPGSNTALCVNAIKEDSSEAWFYRPAAPELLSIQMALTDFVETLRPIVAAAVEEYASGKEGQ
jgi:hypothetical protein